MFDQTTLKQLQQAFQKGKLKGLSGIDPKKLALKFSGPTSSGAMKIMTARILINHHPIISVGFGKVPNQTKGIMFTIAENPHHYNLANINQDLKSLKIQASLTGNQLLLITRVDKKSFFDDIDNFFKANRMLIR